MNSTTIQDQYRVDLPGPFLPSPLGDIRSEQAVCLPIEKLDRDLQERDHVHVRIDGKDIVSEFSNLPADQVQILGLVIGRLQTFET